MLLLRRWYFEGDGQKLWLKLNDGPEELWDLGKGQGNDNGPRETTWVLRGCKAGANRVAIRYDKPGNCSGYRLEPMPGDHVPLVRWGVLNTRQSKGEILKHTSAVGTPLMFGKTPCAGGIGAHAELVHRVSAGRPVQALQVDVGVDGSTEGRGSVIFRVYVDGKEKKKSGTDHGLQQTADAGRGRGRSAAADPAGDRRRGRQPRRPGQLGGRQAVFARSS